MKRLSTVLLAAAAFCGTFATAFGATMTWTGNGDGTSWDDADNWSPAIPTAADTAVFPSGATAATITLTASSVASRIEIGETGFTFSGSDTVPMLDIELGAGITATISTKLSLDADSTWTLGTGAKLNANGNISGSGALTKDGEGELRFGSSGSSRNAATIVLGGVVTVTNQKQLGNALTIGGAGVPARVNVAWGNDWNFNQFTATPTIIVHDGGLYDFTPYTKSNQRSQSVSNLSVEKGGEVRLGRFLFLLPDTGDHLLCGGTISSAADAGGIQVNGGTFQIPATASDAIVSPVRILTQYKYNNGSRYTTFVVPDIAGAPVDLTIRSVQRAWDGRDGIDKRGPGVLRILEGGSYGGDPSQGNTRLYEGTILIDNESGSGTGYSAVSMSPGTTFGGTGTVGGFSEDLTWSGRTAVRAATAKITATGTSGNPATIAPGTLDPDTGAHVFGTLTVGSEAQSSSVSFGDYTTLRASVGMNGAADSIAVYGTIAISATGTALDVAVDPEATPGTYVLASATEGITGSFASVNVSGFGTVAVQENSVVLTVPNPATILLLR